jgi:hypothetical protein
MFGYRFHPVLAMLNWLLTWRVVLSVSMGMMAILQNPAVREAAPVWPKINQNNKILSVTEKYQKRRTAETQCRKFEANIPRKGIARSQSQFPHSRTCERFIYPTIGLPILLQENMWTDPGNI